MNAISRTATSVVRNIDDFIPEESDQFRKFLDEPSLPQHDDLPPPNEDSDEEFEDNNPMVAKYQEELDPEDSEELPGFSRNSKKYEEPSPTPSLNHHDVVQEYIEKRDKLVQLQIIYNFSPLNRRE